MRVNTSIGEFAIRVVINGEGRKYIFRPSFYAMSRIDDVEEQLKECFIAFSMYKEGVLHPRWLDIVMPVFDACLVDEDMDLSILFGCYDADSGMKYIKGCISPKEAIVYAYRLMDWGCNGVETKRSKSNSSESSKGFKFEPEKFVGAAIAHLGLSRDDAWGLTISEFKLAFDSKYPEEESGVKESQNISETEYNELMSEHEKIIAKLNKKKAK